MGGTASGGEKAGLAATQRGAREREDAVLLVVEGASFARASGSLRTGMAENARFAFRTRETVLDGVADVVLCAPPHLLDLLRIQLVAVLVATARDVAVAEEVEAVAGRRVLA